jgi:ABC-type glycerol-3-phosphate transport system substrate-binding protein
MVKTIGKAGIALSVLVMAAVLVSCGGKKEAAAVVVGRDLGGMDIVIGNWWGNWDAFAMEGSSAEEERTVEWRRKIQQDGNFKIREANISSWDEMPQVAATSILASQPAASIFVLQPSWVVALYNQGLLYPVSDCPSVDFSQRTPVDWNVDTQNGFTFDGKSYAFSVGYGSSQHADGVYWNKRLFEEAGLDPDLPYDMQKAGTWTWDAYLDICRKLTRDTNNDGQVDIYAIASAPNASIGAILASNKAAYVERDSSGKFINGTTTPAFLQALQFANRLYTEGVVKPWPQSAEWNWWASDFHDGRVAMRIDAQYIANDLQDMVDDWGFVLVPKGPSASDYHYVSDEVICAIPSSFSAEEADKILYAYYLWQTPAPGNDTSPDAWKTTSYNTYRDARAVDETLTMIRDPKYGGQKYVTFIPGFDDYAIAGGLWGDGTSSNWGDPAQLIEANSQAYEYSLSQVNR